MIFQGEELSANLNAIAAILRAVLWPAVVLVLFICYRVKIGALLEVLTRKVKDARHLKAGQIEIDTTEAIDKVVEQAGRAAGAQDIKRELPNSQIETARLVERNLSAAPIAFSEKLDVVEQRVKGLVEEYERMRREMPGGQQRTRSMNEITAKIRAYAFVAQPLLPFLADGERPGDRLAAICILQVKPEPSFFHWLIERIMREDQAFLLFHSSIAILQLVKAYPFIGVEDAKEAVQSALNHVLGFRGGKPDQNTIEVLNQVLRQLSTRTEEFA